MPLGSSEAAVPLPYEVALLVIGGTGEKAVTLKGSVRASHFTLCPPGPSRNPDLSSPLSLLELRGTPTLLVLQG